MESGIINVRSQRQAEDWSVVLLSQGIESTIQQTVETGQWQLLVDHQNYTPALRLLRVYITENKRPLWVQPVPWSGGLVFDWRSPIWFLLLTTMFYLSTHGLDALGTSGIMDTRRVAQGEWWRFFTAVMLHGDVRHLMSNCVIGIVFLGLAMAAYGPGIALLTTFLCGAAANVASYFIYQHPYRALGASGMVMAALGMLVAHSFWLRRVRRPVGPIVLRGVAGGLLLLVLLGFDPGSDTVAHVSGFVLGVIFGREARFLKSHSESADTIAGLIFVALAGLCWWLALR